MIHNWDDDLKNLVAKVVTALQIHFVLIQMLRLPSSSAHVMINWILEIIVLFGLTVHHAKVNLHRSHLMYIIHQNYKLKNNFKISSLSIYMCH